MPTLEDRKLIARENEFFRTTLGSKNRIVWCWSEDLYVKVNERHLKDFDPSYDVIATPGGLFVAQESENYIEMRMPGIPRDQWIICRHVNPRDHGLTQRDLKEGFMDIFLWPAEGAFIPFSISTVHSKVEGFVTASTAQDAISGRDWLVGQIRKSRGVSAQDRKDMDEMISRRQQKERDDYLEGLWAEEVFGERKFNPLDMHAPGKKDKRSYATAGPIMKKKPRKRAA